MATYYPPSGRVIAPALNPVRPRSRPMQRVPAAPKPPKPPKPVVPTQPVKTPPTLVPATQPGTPAAQEPAPPMLDATYFSNVNQNLFNTQNRINALNQQSAASTTALQNALGNLAYSQPRQSLALEQAANRRGALLTTPYQQSAADLGVQQYNARQGQITADASRQASIKAQIDALNQGIPLYNQGQAAASAARVIAAMQANPATGQGGIPTEVPKPADPPGGGHYVRVGDNWQLVHATGPGQWAPGPPPAVTTPPKPANPKTGGHYVLVNNKWQLIHAIGKNQWAPGPPPKK